MPKGPLVYRKGVQGSKLNIGKTFDLKRTRSKAKAMASKGIADLIKSVEKRSDKVRFLLSKGITPRLIIEKLKRREITIHDLQGFYINDLRQWGFSAKYLKKHFFCTAWGLRLGGYPLEDLVSADYHADELRAAKFSARELKPYFSLKELLSADYSTRDLIDAGYNAKQLGEVNVSSKDLGKYYDQIEQIIQLLSKGHSLDTFANDYSKTQIAIALARLKRLGIKKG